MTELGLIFSSTDRAGSSEVPILAVNALLSGGSFAPKTESLNHISGYGVYQATDAQMR